MKRLSLLILFLIPAFLCVQAQTTPDGESESMLGFARAVDISDGNVFIGEPANVHQPGAVYVFTRSGTEWSKQVKLTASDGQVGDSFGSALAAEGNRILVGAPDISDGNGAAYLFERSGNDSWIEAAKLALSADAAESNFGESVLLSGDLAFIGAPEFNDEQGAVFVYKRSGSGSWARAATISNPDTTKDTGFGSALALEGARLAVSAPQLEGGVVYLYKQDMDNWTMESTLSVNRIEEGARFGSAITLNGDQVLVGAPRDLQRAGAVYVFQKDAETENWNVNSRLLAFDGEPRYLFGGDIEVVGSEVWIGSPLADERRGAIYQFSRDMNGEWTGAAKLVSSESEDGDLFAGTMAVEEHLAVVGLTGDDYGAGTAAIMERDDSGKWSTQKVLIGDTGSSLKAITNNKIKCEDGKADQFGCDNVDLIAFLPIEDLGGERGVRLNDIWGWTDPVTEKEYALVGRNEGTSFVDISDPQNPVYVGNLQKPESARANVWRDIKVYKNHAYIVADGAREHGMQVLDLTQLREFDGEPIQFEETAHYKNIHSAHNVVINEESGFAYIVGSSGGGQTCGGGLHMVNIQDPANPEFAGCFSDPSTGRSGTGYSHDAQCVIYQGPDEEHQGSEICFGANETAVSIADVTDKKNPVALSTASYPDYGYVHQGWLTDDHRYFFQNDELDELTGNVEKTRTIVWDVTDLDDPQFVMNYMHDNPSSDHNLYIKDGMMYQSNYVSGLQVIDVTNPESPKKVGSFDTHPFTEDQPGFAGTWSNYPFFKSGIVIMTSSREGLFILDANPETIAQ